MLENDTLREFSQNYGIEVTGRLSEKAYVWKGVDSEGNLFVIKEVDKSQDPHTILRALRALYTPFRYPVPITSFGDRYLIYPWIEGKRFDLTVYEEQERNLEEILELAGRIQALLRSLHLVPFFEKSMQSSDSPESHDTASSIATRINFGCSPMLDQEIKKARRYEVAASYRWVNEGLKKWRNTIVETGIWKDSLIDQFGELLDASPAIHLPITGNNLAHGKFTPDHVILCPDNTLGVVSWRVDPRPRRYMQLSFLSWLLFHDSKTGIYEKFSRLLPRFFAKTFYFENLLVLNICILEQGYYFGKNGFEDDDLIEEKISSANRILSEGLAKVIANRS
ncbi:MAG TPA: hypothetical protein ENG51_24005 [Deltaproteobacteria bacterium]|nr:hypothetical protein [Deltaproteobacteria bacterium]